MRCTIFCLQANPWCVWRIEVVWTGEVDGMTNRMSRWFGGLGCWILSAGVHAVCLGALAFVRFPSGGTSDRPGSGAFSSIETPAAVRIRELTAPKPQVKPLTSERLLSPSAERKPHPEVRPEPTRNPSFSIPSHLSEELVRPLVNFFGNRSAAGRICFVVDCSGSMFGRMGLVRRQLAEAVSRLTPDQFFSVLFFGGNGRILELGRGELLRAVPAAKQDAIQLAESVRPEGRTDALSALARAMSLRTSDGRGPDLIYFLTDGFDLDKEGTASLAEQAEELRRKLAPQAVIHTIAFWASPMDRQVLEIIAQRSGGSFTCVDYEPENRIEDLK
ncbi:MAG TPA: VWA domain-containing protein [Anaerohalosphaeraceae bacterium]|nr:VWA domain-containing protein [Anaerohalosphaeraceae bacterium]